MNPDRPSPGALPAHAMLAAALVAVSPAALVGASLKARAGPQSEAWMNRLFTLLPPETRGSRIPLHIGDDRLLGGLDLAATLRSGRRVVQRGLLAEYDGGVLALPMAERASPGLAAKLTAVLDAGAVALERDAIAERHPTRFVLVLLDESVAEEEHPPRGLLDRLAFHLQLDPPAGGMTALPDEMPPGLSPAKLTRGDIAAAQQRLAAIAVGEDVLEALCAASLALGISSARALSFALHAARAIAALRARESISQEDASLAARLVLAPRATRLPAPEGTTEQMPEPPPPADTQAEAERGNPENRDDSKANRQQSAPENVILAAAKAAIPPDLLARLESAATRRPKTTGSGRASRVQAFSLRGRPVGTRRGVPRPGQRLNVLATLRAAAPWQVIRRQNRSAAQNARRLEIRRDDFRVTRFKHHPETTTIFVVDASGSAALHRLAEAKGAVELLLADCYVRRDSVALMTFGGQGAELLLPPTRSLTRVKRSLAGFPAGGGTPLANAIEAADALAESLRRKAGTPTIVFLTDGRGNIALDGKADRTRAASDAQAAARALAASGTASLLIDISQRPRPLGLELANEMQARYLALPQADAAALSTAVQAYARREVH